MSYEHRSSAVEDSLVVGASILISIKVYLSCCISSNTIIGICFDAAWNMLFRDHIQKIGGEESTSPLGTVDKVWALPIFEQRESKFQARINTVDASFQCDSFLPRACGMQCQFVKSIKVWCDRV